MHIENRTIESDLEVTDQLVIYGMVKGNITVVSGGVLQLQGMCAQCLYINVGGSAVVNGMVIGDIVNDGGSLEVLGTVQGSVKTIHGQTTISPKAIVVQGVTQVSGDNSQAVGLIGGAALGAAIAGPVGAVVGGLIGAILGKEGKGLG